MVTGAVTEQARSSEIRDEAPMLAHLAFVHVDPPTALCGKRLIGVPAPDSAARCLVCEELWEGR